MSPIIGINSDALVITRPLILQSNSICEIKLYSLVIAVAVRLRNRVSIPEKGQKVFFSQKCTERLSDPQNLLFNGYRRPIARIKLLGSEALHSPLSSAKYNNVIRVAKSPVHYTQLRASTTWRVIKPKDEFDFL
jgi:hypothetical protein